MTTDGVDSAIENGYTRAVGTFVEPSEAYEQGVEEISFDNMGRKVERPEDAHVPLDAYFCQAGTQLLRRLSDQPIAVVNPICEEGRMNFSNPVLDTLEAETGALLDRGGILVVILWPYCRLSRGSPYADNYCWLPFGLCEQLSLYSIACPPGTNFRTTSNDPDLVAYMLDVSSYSFAIELSMLKSLAYTSDLRILAEGGFSRDVVAWEFNIHRGLVIFLPVSEAPNWYWHIWRYAGRRWKQLQAETARAAFEPHFKKISRQKPDIRAWTQVANVDFCR